MNVLNMPDVTLLILNPVHGSDMSARVLNHCMSIIRFGDVVHLSDKPSTIPCAARFVQVPKMTWGEAQEFQAASFLRGGILRVFITLPFPLWLCIRRGAQPNYTWLDEIKLAVLPRHSTLSLAKFQELVAGLRGQTKMPTPRAVAT